MLTELRVGTPVHYTISQPSGGEEARQGIVLGAQTVGAGTAEAQYRISVQPEGGFSSFLRPERFTPMRSGEGMRYIARVRAGIEERAGEEEFDRRGMVNQQWRADRAVEKALSIREAI